MSNELSKQVKNGELDWQDLITGILHGDDSWDEMYNEYIDQFPTHSSTSSMDWHVDLINKERKAYQEIWQGQPLKASELYAQLADISRDKDKSLEGWYHHWHGLSLMCASDRRNSFIQFITAANIQSELGRPSEERERAFAFSTSNISLQAKKITQWYRKRKHQIQSAITQVNNDLVYGPETQKAEEAFKLLAKLIGLESERPDNEQRTGPDVIWRGDIKPRVIGFELKTNKDIDGEYSKTEISKCHDHEEWLKQVHDVDSLVIIGKVLPVSEHANPSINLRIIELESVIDLFSRLKNLYQAIESGDMSNLENSVQIWLDYYGLIWPSCIFSLDNRLAYDLKKWFKIRLADYR